MSKLIEKLKQGTQKPAAPIGFHAAGTQVKPRILLIAAVSQPESKVFTEYVSNADAALVVFNRLGSGLHNLEKLSKATDIPCGSWLREIAWEKEETPEFNGDFIVFPEEMPLFKLPEKVGRILELKSVTADAMLRAIDELPVDAILMAEKPELLTWHYLAVLQRLENLLLKPLLAVIPGTINGEDLQMLWRVGVDGVIIEVSSNQMAERLKELRQVVDKAEFPLPRKSRKADVRLPFINPTPAAPEEEEEEPE